MGMRTDLMIVAPTAAQAQAQAQAWKREVPNNVRVIGAMQSTLGLRPRVVLVQQDNQWQRWEQRRERLGEWFRLEVMSRLRPGAFFARVTNLDVMAVKKIAQLLHDHPDDVGPARDWIEKNLSIVGAPKTWSRESRYDAIYIDDLGDLSKVDPYTLHRMRNAIRNVERYSPGIELSMQEDNVPAAVLARRAPKHIVVPTDLDDHLIPDAEPEGIVPHPKRS